MTAAGLLLEAATVRGVQHRATGQPRQDAFAIGTGHADDGGEHAVAVVCDGVGSLSRSDEAADLVSRDLVRNRALGQPWPDAFAAANDLLGATAREALSGGGDPVANGMATTAVAVSVRCVAGEWTGEVAWVGDSALWHLSADEQWTLVTSSAADDSSADYHSGAVTALPSDDGGCASREFSFPDGSLFLMSDGVSNPLGWSREVKKQLAIWWADPPDPFTFAAQVGFARKTHMDDRTVVGIWASPADELAADPGAESNAGTVAL